MAHPLIYYAEIQPPINRRQTCDQPRKENPFKKAFKWYTKERTLWNKNDTAPEKSGFADWLDNKYAEYLRESGQQTKGCPSLHESRITRTIAESCSPCTGRPKKFGRFQSPWKKRRRLGKYSGDVPEKCPAGSCEFLLKPKEIMRAASDTCCLTTTSGDKSNSTVTSSNMPCNTKCSGRSQSLSGVGCEKNVLKHSDTAPAVQDCPNNKDEAPTKQGQTKLPKSMCACPQGSSKEDALNQSIMDCNCLQEKKAVKLPTKEEGPTNQPKPLQKEILKVGTVLLKEQDLTNETGPCCKCLQEKITEVVKVSSKEHDSTNQLKPLPENVLKVPSKVQNPTSQLKPLQENELKVPSKIQNPTSQLKPFQENGLKVPSKVQDPTDQLGLCCRCNLEKIPKSVQVPSQCRAVEASSQCPEEKIVSVHEKTQYEPTPEVSRSTQKLAPCCCKTCNKLIPSPGQLLCIPVKASPQMCLMIAPAQVVAPKKQKARRLSVSCQNGEAIKCKVNSQTQHQPEPSACSKDTATNQNNCHEVNQVFGPVPILRQSYSTVAINEEKGEYSILKEVSVVKKFTRSVTCASSDAAQTSDHSIRFEKDACSRQHPLFFKIICPDVSKNE